MGVLRAFQRCFNEVSMVFRVSVSVLQKFPGCFKEVSRVY